MTPSIEGEAQASDQSPETTPAVVPPKAEAPAATDAGASAAGGDGVAPVTPDESAPSPSPAAKPRDWRDDRIAQLTAKLKQAKEVKPELASPTPVVQPAPSMAESEIERRASELAAQQTQLNAFNQACSNVASQGKQSYADFDSKINELKQLAGDGDLQQQMIYNSFIAAAIETGEAPRLLYELGGDLNEAARIMAMPPLKMAVELTKRAVTKPVGDLTKTPKPITPVGGQRASHSAISPDDPDRADNLSTAEWMKRRSAQAEEARKRN